MKKDSFLKYLWDGPLKLFLAATIVSCVIFPLYWKTTALGISVDGPITWSIFGGIWTLIIVINYFNWKKL
ncbi:MAG TPA: hypothetical protein VL443_24285 [Cyclobacteriaceae bacterium]|jgi:hypothetical protein|nr:hypothetical protein [Cyclobacteriaceae bacterium]